MEPPQPGGPGIQVLSANFSLPSLYAHCNSRKSEKGQERDILFREKIVWREGSREEVKENMVSFPEVCHPRPRLGSSNMAQSHAEGLGTAMLERDKDQSQTPDSGFYSWSSTDPYYQPLVSMKGRSRNCDPRKGPRFMDPAPWALCLSVPQFLSVGGRIYETRILLIESCIPS